MTTSETSRTSQRSGRIQPGEQINRAALGRGEGDVVADGEGLGGDLAEQQKHRNHDEQVHPLVLRPEYMDDGRRRNHRGGNVDQLVADEDGDDQAPGLAQHLPDQLEPRIAILAHLLQLHLIEREQAGFGARKKS
jgi:hypothetical protein